MGRTKITWRDSLQGKFLQSLQNLLLPCSLKKTKMSTFANNAGKDFDINLSFVDFRDEEDFFDVTLAAESSDGTIKGLRAHKLILSACSPVLRSLLKEQARLTSNSKMMPVMLYLRGISARGLNHVLDFIYKGTINLAQEELNDFLAVGESLQIPLMERPKPGPTKRASPAPKSVEKSKKSRVSAEGDNDDPDAEEGDLAHQWSRR